MDETRIICIGICGNKETYLFSRNSNVIGNRFRVDKSDDGLSFKRISEFELPNNSKVKGILFQDFRMSEQIDRRILLARIIKKGIGSLQLFESTDLTNWKRLSKIESIHDTATLVGNYKYNDKFVMYAGGKSIKLLDSVNFVDWSNLQIVHEFPQTDMKHYCIMGSADEIDEGILVTYFLSNNPHNLTSYAIQAMLFDSDDPSRPLWNEPKTIMNSEGHKLPIGVVVNESITSYWQRWDGGLLAINHGDLKTFLGSGVAPPHPRLERHNRNPLLVPNTNKDWQSVAVFNPAAIYDEGKVHLLYRAVGESNASAWGHAESKDGINFDSLDEPVYTPDMHFKRNFSIPLKQSEYVSGPGWGGCEDPRAVIIDDRIYVIYVAFDGFNPQQVSLTSIDIDDFRNYKWKWSVPVTLSPPGRSNKNWVLFPEKIDGKFALLHSITPKISIDYIDNFDDVNTIDSTFAQSSRYDHWDNWVRGAGPPPIKTSEGWLLFYHAMDVHDPDKYKLGAMLLDLDNPTRIIARSRSPVLEPRAEYETQGLKSGVIFATGALVLGDEIYIYYGGSDNTINVAYYNLDKFVYHLKHHTNAKPDKLILSQSVYD